MRTIFFLIVMGLSFFAYAKRLPPVTVKPISNAGLRYEVPSWSSDDLKKLQNGGFIRVVNIRDGLPICTKQVYETKYDKNLEQDVQDNFITRLKVEKDQLIISSEKIAPVKKPFANFCD
ncbi:MAG: hypothetical protein ACK5P5_04445 [Pseudobdellovibrionaceae bacterium]|jgi:hypothetical protein